MRKWLIMKLYYSSPGNVFFVGVSSWKSSVQIHIFECWKNSYLWSLRGKRSNIKTLLWINQLWFTFLEIFYHLETDRISIKVLQTKCNLKNISNIEYFLNDCRKNESISPSIQSEVKCYYTYQFLSQSRKIMKFVISVPPSTVARSLRR